VGLVLAPDSSHASPVIRSLITGIALFWVVTTRVRTRAQAMWVLGGLSTGGAIVGSFAVLQHVLGTSSRVAFATSTGEIIGRVDAGFGHPNQMAGFLVLLVPLALAGVILQRRGRLLYGMAALLAVVAIYLSFSRATLLALAVVPLVLLRGRHLLLAVSVLVVLVAVATPGLLRERFLTLTSDRPEVTVRGDIWRTAEQIWAQHPLTGTGLGSFPRAYAEARVPGKTFLPATDLEPPPHAHDIFLNVLAEQGLLGCTALLAVLVAAFTRAVGLRRSSQWWVRLLGRAILASLAAFMVHNLFDVTLAENTQVYLWGLLGLLSALAAVDGRAEAGLGAAAVRPFGTELRWGTG
jgi:O-antigen ligase